VRWTCSPQYTPLNTIRASRDAHVAPCCPTSATQHVTTFFCAKMHGLDSVSCRDPPSGIWAYTANSTILALEACLAPESQGICALCWLAGGWLIPPSRICFLASMKHVLLPYPLLSKTTVNTDFARCYFCNLLPPLYTFITPKSARYAYIEQHKSTSIQ